MNTTATQPIRVAILLSAGAILPQVTSRLGNERYLAGKQAYDYLGDVKGRTAPQIRDVLSKLGLSSIAPRDLNDPTEAALAIASAALLDATKGRRATVTEQLELAMDLLDDELGAGL